MGRPRWRCGGRFLWLRLLGVGQTAGALGRSWRGLVENHRLSFGAAWGCFGPDPGAIWGGRGAGETLTFQGSRAPACACLGVYVIGYGCAPARVHMHHLQVDDANAPGWA
jgi:hypothetical protein